MRALLWVGLGSIATGILLLARDTRVSENTSMYGEPKRAAIPMPAGWRRATNAEVTALPELRDAAVALRSTPGFTTMEYGTLEPFVASNGTTYATWIEQHYHEPGGAIRPWGYHHGVTVLARI